MHGIAMVEHKEFSTLAEEHEAKIQNNQSKNDNYIVINKILREYYS